LPFQDEFNTANAKLDDARKRLEECKDDLQQIDGQVSELKQNFGKMTSEAEALKVALKKTTDILGTHTRRAPLPPPPPLPPSSPFLQTHRKV
jgi:chromosome segregation ATPase